MRRKISLMINSSLEGPRALHLGVGLARRTTWQWKSILSIGLGSSVNDPELQKLLRHQPVEPLGFEKGVIDCHGISRQEL